MILEEPVRSAAKGEFSASKESVTIPPPNMEGIWLTLSQRLILQDSFWSATIQIPCEEVIDYRDEDADAIIIA